MTDAAGHPLEVEDVVQIDPRSGPTYGGCLMFVVALDGWVQGVIPVPGPEGARLLDYRADPKDVRWVGRAAFMGPRTAPQAED